MSGAGLIEMLAARLGGRGARRAAPALREALAEVSARGANQSDPLVTVYRGGGDGQFWTPNAETAAGYGPVRRGMLDTNGFGSAEYTAEMANQSDDFGAFIQSQMARAESENLPGVTLDGIPDLPNWDIQRQYIVRDPSRLRDIAEHGPASEAAPSLRDALSKINAARTGPDAGPSQAGRTPSNVSVSITNRGGLRQIDWDLKDGSESFSLAHRAAAEREGIDAAVAAFDADIVRHPNARYYIEPITRALARRYRRMAGERGFAMEPHGNGYILSRTAPDGGPLRDGPNAGSDRNALQRALRERMERE